MSESCRGRTPTATEFHVWETGDALGFREAVERWRSHLQGPVLDIGCGEGRFLAALDDAAIECEGVELTPNLAVRAASQGIKVHEEDGAVFTNKHGSRFRTFVMLDFIEHVSFDAIESILGAVPPGAKVILQTPNTNSIIGHQFYMQVPSHVAPYSPFVIERLLARHGIVKIEDGTVYGGLPWTGIRRRVTEFLLVKLLGFTMSRLLIEGANYWVVGEKRTDPLSGRNP